MSLCLTVVKNITLSELSNKLVKKHLWKCKYCETADDAIGHMLEFSRVYEDIIEEEKKKAVERCNEAIGLLKWVDKIPAW